MKNSKTYYYARVSSGEQNLERQIAAFKLLGASEEDIIADKQSGKDLQRPNYLLLRNKLLRTGDTLVIKSLDRLSRNKSDIRNELEYFKQNHIRLKVLDLPTTLVEVPDGQEWIIDMVNNIIIEVLASIAEQERHTIRQRQQEGIEAAQNKGVKFGRPTAEYPQNWTEVYTEWKSKKINGNRAMELLGLKRTTFYKLVSLYEEN